jgi:hypothetical protein
MKMGQRLLTATEKVWKVGPGRNISSFVEVTMHLLFPLLLIIGSPMATDMNKQYKKEHGFDTTPNRKYSITKMNDRNMESTRSVNEGWGRGIQKCVRYNIQNVQQ